MISLTALSLGHALDLDPAGNGVVHSVFAHAVNLEIRGDLWTLVSDTRFDLPFGIRLAARYLDRFGLRGGDPVHVRSGIVGLGSAGARLVIDCRAAPRWLPVSQGGIEPGLEGRLGVVAAAGCDRAWRGSPRMAHAVLTALEKPDALDKVLPGVVGCGPGLTPAGDDVLVGILAVLKAQPSGENGARAAEALGRLIMPLLPATTDVSGHLLRQALQGLFGRPVHELVSALTGNSSPAQLREAVRRVVETGATSGADTCAGVLGFAPSFFIPEKASIAA